VVVARRALPYGAFDYVTKPIDIVHLTRGIDARRW
jgi:DNA-binding response OmpR family regulator